MNKKLLNRIDTSNNQLYEFILDDDKLCFAMSYDLNYDNNMVSQIKIIVNKCIYKEDILCINELINTYDFKIGTFILIDNILCMKIGGKTINGLEDLCSYVTYNNVEMIDNNFSFINIFPEEFTIMGAVYHRKYLCLTDIYNITYSIT